MLKIVYPICCGMDVHKDFLVACIASTNQQGVTSYKSRRFSAFTGDLRLCALFWDGALITMFQPYSARCSAVREMAHTVSPSSSKLREAGTISSEEASSA